MRRFFDVELGWKPDRARHRGPAQETGMLNTIAGQQGAKATQLENQLIPTYTSMLTEGYTPAEETGMTTSGIGALNSNYAGARREAANTAARTNNASNLTAQEDQLARDEGVAAGNEAAGLQKSFADTRLAQEDTGAQGLENLFATNEGSANTMYGLGAHMFAPGQQGYGTGLNPFNVGLASGIAGALPF